MTADARSAITTALHERPAIDLGPNPAAADKLDDLADALDTASDEQARGYEQDGERIPDAMLFVQIAVEEAASSLRRAAVLIRGHLGPEGSPW